VKAPAARWIAASWVAAWAAGAAAQNGPVPAARVNVLLAEDRRAATPRDLTTLRTAARGRDAETARLALRALGRLEQPALIVDLLPALSFPLPETRSEAVNAIGQAAQGWIGTTSGPRDEVTPGSVLTVLVERLAVEQEPAVRAVICETIGRVPYRSVDEATQAETAMVEHGARSETISDRLGLAKGVEAFLRVNRTVRPPDGGAVALARALLGLPDASAPAAASAPPAGNTQDAASTALDRRLGPAATNTDPLRDARVRRLALEALITAQAIDDDVVARSMEDADSQVRRLAMRAAGVTGRGLASLPQGLGDLSPIVRLEALRATHARGGASACAIAIDSSRDPEPPIALLALDQLAGCADSAEAVALLERIVNDVARAAAPRGWHRAAHALVSLAGAAPARAAAALPAFRASRTWQLRMYAARAAVQLRDRQALEALARDADDNVAETAIEGLAQVAGHAADAVYLDALLRPGYPVLRAAAIALRGTPDAARAQPALQAALTRLQTAAVDNSTDVRTAIIATLAKLGAVPPPPKRPAPVASSLLNPDNLQRLAAPRARVTIRNVGVFELALITTEAPATVLRFAQLAESGYYNGLTFHRVVPNFVIQGGSPGANEYVGWPEFMRDEVGQWPHVRGAVGISTRGRDTGDGQIFINLVDNPRLDHQYTVFAQVLNGLAVVDQILEGDVIERIDIVP
jgi:cyclophilin family peptidyl-prolyl cis-trans isomerase